MSIRRLACLGVLLLVILSAAPRGTTARAAAINLLPVERVSGEAGGSYAAISGDGRYVVYESVGESAAGYWNVYLYDRQLRRTEIISRAQDGGPSANTGDYSSPPAVSGDGRFVVYMSQAQNIVALQTGGLPNIYLRDRQQGTNELISAGLGGKAANGPSWNPAVSAGGRYVAFQSHASNLVVGDENDSVDIFLRDRQTGVTELVSVTGSNEQGTDFNDYGFSSLSVSADGRYVAFSYQHLPVGSPPEGGSAIYLRDRQARETRQVAAGSFPALSADGRALVFVSGEALVANDKNGAPDVYLYDLQARTFERISASVGAAEPRSQEILCAPAVSADGRYVAFETSAALLPEDGSPGSDIYLRDRQTGDLRLVTAAAGGQAAFGEAHYPALSADGGVVAFTSNAAGLASSGLPTNHVYARAVSQLAFAPGDHRVFIPLVGR